jgi:hypothetical protein
MNVPALIAGLYPPGVRQRWGTEMAREVAACGPRSWPDTVIGAVRLWTHPSDWPETASGQTQRVLAAALFAEMAVAALLLRAAGPPRFLAADPGHYPTASAWLVLVLVGAALAAPLPPLRPGALRRLAALTARTLAAPALALLALYLTARSGLADHPSRPVHFLLLGCYWTTLSYAGLRACTLVSRISRIAIMPGVRRLRPALFFIGAGFAIAAGQELASAVRPTVHAGTFALSCALATLAAAAVTVGHDLHAAKTPAA